jgi:hypothetical protein
MTRRNFYSDDKTEKNLAIAVDRTGASASFLIRTCLNNYLHLVIPSAQIRVTEEVQPQEKPMIAFYVPRRDS